MKNKSYDVVVCGAGAAGIAASIAVNDGVTPEHVDYKKLKQALPK